MAYDGPEIVKRVTDALGQRPWITLRELESRLKIDRHTIRRHLRSQLGVSYLELRGRAVQEAIRRTASGGRLLERQDVAKKLGCSRSTLLRWLRRT